MGDIMKKIIAAVLIGVMAAALVTWWIVSHVTLTMNVGTP